MTKMEKATKIFMQNSKLSRKEMIHLFMTHPDLQFKETTASTYHYNISTKLKATVKTVEAVKEMIAETPEEMKAVKEMFIVDDAQIAEWKKSVPQFIINYKQR
jgi:hypothetical protein